MVEFSIFTSQVRILISTSLFWLFCYLVPSPKASTGSNPVIFSTILSVPHISLFSNPEFKTQHLHFILSTISQRNSSTLTPNTSIWCLCSAYTLLRSIFFEKKIKKYVFSTRNLYFWRDCMFHIEMVLKNSLSYVLVVAWPKEFLLFSWKVLQPLLYCLVFFVEMIGFLWYFLYCSRL